MRPIFSVAALLSLAVSSFADGWLIKPPYDAKVKLTYSVTVNASMGGQDHEAKMKQVLTIDSKSDTTIKGKDTWTDITLDGGSQPDEPPAWDVSFNLNGAISSAGENADYARMLAPTAFVYPEKEIKAGDKWTAKFKPASDAKEMTVEYEVVELTKVGDTEALKVKSKLTEDGPMKGDNVYWVAKDGKVLKFELDLKNWTVPFAGAGDMDAKIKGELVTK